jgi:hypothetical protein
MIGRKPRTDADLAAERPVEDPPFVKPLPGLGGGAEVLTCGSCEFSELVPQDVRQRICHGLPPTPLALPAQGPGGQMGIQIQFLHPSVQVSTRACSLHRRKASIVAAR